MRKVLAVLLVVAAAGTMAFAADSQLTVPGKRVVVIQPGDVVVQAGDSKLFSRLQIDVSPGGEVAVTDVTPRPVGRLGEVTALDVMTPFVTSYVATCWQDAAATIACPTVAPSPRYIKIQGVYQKFNTCGENTCAWIFPGITWNVGASSANVTGVSLSSIDNDFSCGGVIPCFIGDPSSANWNGGANPFEMIIKVDISGVVRRFRVYVDVTGFVTNEGCPSVPACP